MAGWLCRNGFKETNNVFSFRRIVAQSVRYQYIIKSARSTWNFVRQQATLAQGSASEAHMNMDVNLCRLPVIFLFLSKCLSAPCRGIHICAEAGEYFAVYIAWILTESCCYLFCYLSMLIYFHSLYHKCISLKRQTLKKIKKTTNNIKIIN